MSMFTHNICGDDWNRRRPETPLADEDRGKGVAGVCCFCGQPNEDGIFVRAKPEDTICDSDPEEDHKPAKKAAQD